MTRSIRHLSISPDAAVAATQNAENARDGRATLEGKVSGHLRTLNRYSAIGATTAKIPLAATSSVRPKAVVLVNAQLSDDPGSDIGVTGRPNFYHDSFGLGVYEPSGLVANTPYDLTFLILE